MSDDYRCEGDVGGCFYLATGACPECGIALCDGCFNAHLTPLGRCPDEGDDPCDPHVYSAFDDAIDAPEYDGGSLAAPEGREGT